MAQLGHPATAATFLPDLVRGGFDFAEAHRLAQLRGRSSLRPADTTGRSPRSLARRTSRASRSSRFRKRSARPSRTILAVPPRFGHDVLHLGGSVHAVAGSPSGALVAATSSEETVVWDATTSRVVARTEGAMALAFGDDDTLWLAYIDLRRWRFREREPARVFAGFSSPLAVCRGTGRVAAKRRESAGGVDVLGAAGELVRRVEGRGEDARSVGFSTDGAWVAVGWEAAAIVVNVETGEERALPVPRDGTGVVVGFVPDSSTVIVTRWVCRELLIVTLDTEVVRAMQVDDCFDGLALSADGSRLALSACDGVRVLDLDGRERTKLPRRGEWEPLAFVGDRVAVAQHHAVHLVDEATGTWEGRPPGHDDGASQIAVARDGSFVATAARFDRMVHVWEPHGAHRVALGPVDLSVASLAIAPNSISVAVASDGVVRLYDARTGALRFERNIGRGTVAVAFTQDALGRPSLIAASASGRVMLCDAVTAVEQKRLRDGPDELDLADVSVAVSPEGSLAAVAAHEEIAVFDCITGAVRVTKLTKGLASFAPDASHVAHRVDGAVEVFRAADGSTIARPRVGPLGALAMLEAGRLATVPYGATRVEVLELDGDTAVSIECGRRVCSVFSAGPGRVAIGFGDGTAEIRDVPPLPPSPSHVARRALEDELALVRELLHALGARPQRAPYRDAPGVALDDDGCGVRIERAGIAMHVRVERRGVSVFAISIVAEDAPDGEAALATADPGSFGPTAPNLRIGDGRVALTVSRDALPDAPTLEEWVSACAASVTPRTPRP